ncbi:MAG: MotA/TolQ/ExbB proton channel family protein [Lentisphaerae bacterium]|nr:MotA/TolQ/ExbB proton channel family protein [Lentisphaerota bacterium]
MFLIKLMNDGGPVMWVIMACSVLALFIFLIKVFQFHRDEISVRELMRGLFNVLKRNGVVEALTLCDNTPGPVARLLSAGILARQRGDRNIRSAIDNAAMDELPKLERHIRLLGVLGYVLLLLGLLGTVIGMLNAFEAISASEYFSAGDIGGPLAEALLTTAAGLTAAIPCYIAYSYLVMRVEALTLDMEKAALELTAFFERQDAGESAEDHE